MSADPRPLAHDGTPVLSLWAGNLLAPAAFLLDLQLAYMMTSVACRHQTTLHLHLVHAGTIALGLLGTWLAWRGWRRVGRELPDGATGPVARSRFLGAVGVLTSLLFVLVMVAQWLPQLFLGPCQ
jgi:hypothetical protein